MDYTVGHWVILSALKTDFKIKSEKATANHTAESLPVTVKTKPQVLGCPSLHHREPLPLPTPGCPPLCTHREPLPPHPPTPGPPASSLLRSHWAVPYTWQASLCLSPLMCKFLLKRPFFQGAFLFTDPAMARLPLPLPPHHTSILSCFPLSLSEILKKKKKSLLTLNYNTK